jgi:RNA polymerase sigma factor (sigma-70 family)
MDSGREARGVEPGDRSTLYGAAAAGDAGAAEALLQSYLPRLRAFVRARLAPELRARESDSDVVQSVCRELLQHRGGFSYRGETEFRGWLFTAAANKVKEKIRFHRQRKRDIGRERDAGTELLGEGSPSSAAIAQERVAELELALDALGPADREVIGLARLAELPMGEVAARLGKTEAAARKQLGRALLRLAAELRSRTARG